MRRLMVILSTSLLMGALLVGPGAGAATAAPIHAATGWVCYPHGTGGGGPSTTLSAAFIDLGNPSRSAITCIFRNVGIGSSPTSLAGAGGIGGACSYETAAFRVDFRLRFYLVLGTGARLLCMNGVVSVNSDLSITKTNGVTTVVSGASTTYTIVVGNAGPNTATGAAVSDTFPATISGDTWTAVGSGGASGFSASGTGAIADTVNLPAGATVTYTVAASVSPSATGTLTNTATVAAPSGTTDANLANNSATDSDTVIQGRTLTTIVSNFDGRDARLFDLISYGTSQCTNQPEDGFTTCSATVGDGTVVTVDLQDESFFTFTCPGGSAQDAAGSGPYTGRCVITMDANKQVSVLGDAIAP